MSSSGEDDDDWDFDTALSDALADLPDDEVDTEHDLDEQDMMLRAALGGAEQLDELSPQDRECFYTSAASAVNACVVAYGNANEGPHRIVFAGEDINWRRACDTAMSRIREKVRSSCSADGVDCPILPSLYLRDFKRVSPMFGSVMMTMTTVKPDHSRALVEIFQNRQKVHE